jgi:hypothetical protein
LRAAPHLSRAVAQAAGAEPQQARPPRHERRHVGGRERVAQRQQAGRDAAGVRREAHEVGRLGAGEALLQGHAVRQHRGQQLRAPPQLGLVRAQLGGDDLAGIGGLTVR